MIRPRFFPKNLLPTPEQQAIQCAQQRISLIEANAGAAKTTTLALRIGEALTRGLAPEQILGLVFTPEALEVLRQRLLELGVAPAVVRRLALYRIEDFAQQVLTYWEEQEPPRMTQMHALQPMMLEAQEMLSQRYAHREEFYLEIRSHHVALSQFYQSQLRLKARMDLRLGEDEDLFEKAALAGVTVTDFLWAQQYERLRQSPYEGVLFRGPFDATYDLACALLDQPELLAHIPVYRVIVVDELHDANEAAFQILRALMSRQQSYLVAAGDKDQVIHQDLAAEATYLYERFAAYFDSIARYPLSQTYRHGPYLAYAAGAFKKKRVESALPLATQIHVHPYAMTGAAMSTPLVQAVQLWVQQGGTLAACAVLLRDTHQSVAIENALMAANIPYRLEGMVGYLQRDEILFLRALLALALKDYGEVNLDLRRQMLRALVLFFEIDILPSEFEEVVEDLLVSPQLLPVFLRYQVKKTSSIKNVSRLEKILALAQSSAPHHMAFDFLNEAVAIMDTVHTAKRLYVLEHQAQVIQKSIDAFMDLASQQQSDLHGLYQWCIDREKINQQPVALHLSCVAQAKGKEFEHVLLPFLAQGEFPSAQSPALIEQNLFYVAITRAQKRLSLFVPDKAHWVSDYVAAMSLEQVKPLAQQRLQQLRVEAQQAQKGAPAVREPQAAYKTPRIDLVVPFAEKDQAKQRGARWDPVKRVWYVPAGGDPSRFERWLKAPR